MAKEQYFQVRKNIREVIRIFRGDFEGHDITRLQIWYKDRKSEEYRPGKIMPFPSSSIPGIIEGLAQAAQIGTSIDLPTINVQSPNAQNCPLEDEVYSVLERHKQPMHWENIAELISADQGQGESQHSTWTVYNLLLSNTDRFRQVEDDVFESV